MTCPLCRKLTSRRKRWSITNCTGSIANQIDAEIALANEHRRGGRSIPLDSTCMVCNRWKPCVRCVDIGWVCLDCQRESM
jgi:hypothetical protein